MARASMVFDHKNPYGVAIDLVRIEILACFHLHRFHPLRPLPQSKDQNPNNFNGMGNPLIAGEWEHPYGSSPFPLALLHLHIAPFISFAALDCHPLHTGEGSSSK